MVLLFCSLQGDQFAKCCIFSTDLAPLPFLSFKICCSVTYSILSTITLMHARLLAKITFPWDKFMRAFSFTVLFYDLAPKMWYFILYSCSNRWKAIIVHALQEHNTKKKMFNWFIFLYIVSWASILTNHP